MLKQPLVLSFLQSVGLEKYFCEVERKLQLYYYQNRAMQKSQNELTEFAMLLPANSKALFGKEVSKRKTKSQKAKNDVKQIRHPFRAASDGV